MNTTLASHLLPLQPPFPLIYIGDPYYAICKQIASLIFVDYKNSENMGDFINSKDKFHTIPVVELSQLDYGFPYENPGETSNLGFREGRKDIPWQDIVEHVEDFNIPNTINKHVVFEQFAKSLNEYGCTIDKPNSIKINIELIFDDQKNVIAIQMSSKDLPINATFDPEFKQEDYKKLEKTYKEIILFKKLLGNFKVRFMTEIETEDTTILEKINKYLDSFQFEWDVTDKKCIRLSELNEDEIKTELLWLKQNNCIPQMGEDSKTKILKALGKRLDIHPYEYPELWDLITKNKWVWMDEYTGVYKIAIDKIQKTDQNVQHHDTKNLNLKVSPQAEVPPSQIL